MNEKKTKPVRWIYVCKGILRNTTQQTMIWSKWTGHPACTSFYSSKCLKTHGKEKQLSFWVAICIHSIGASDRFLYVILELNVYLFSMYTICIIVCLSYWTSHNKVQECSKNEMGQSTSWVTDTTWLVIGIHKLLAISKFACNFL